MNNVSRILYITDTRSDAWTATCLLAGALPLDRFRATVATVGPAADVAARDELMHLAPHATLTTLDGKLETDADCWKDVDELRAKLLLFCERSKPDLIHTTQLCLGKLSWAGPRVVTAMHDLLSWSRITGRTPKVDIARYRTEVKAGLAAASVVVAPSAFMARELERQYKPTDACRVIRQGTAPAPRAASERGLVAVACGDFDDPGQQLDLLASVAARLPGPVGIAGETPRVLPKPLVALGKPPRKELLALMAGAKVSIGLAKYDPVGLRIADAQAAGARLVLLDSPVHRELWSSVADLVHDAESLSNAVIRAAAAPRLPRPDVPRHSISATAQAYVRLYEELLSAPQQQQPLAA